MESTRERLAQHLLEQIVPLFRLGDPKYDPWWWPIGTGKEWEDWFPAPLTQTDIERTAGLSPDRVLASLQKGPRHQTPVPVNPADYAWFQGFWGEATVKGRLIAVVSIRPSRGPYPSHGWAYFPRLLHSLECGGIHITDVITRRGEGRWPLQDFPGEENPSHYSGPLVDELVALALGSSDLRIVAMEPRALRYLKDYHVISALTERLGWTPTLFPRSVPFPKDLTAEKDIDKWRQAFD